MLNRIATMIGYAKAPRATFMVKHPVKGTKAFTAYYGLRSRQTAALAAAALAVPVGVWLLARH